MKKSFLNGILQGFSDMFSSFAPRTKRIIKKPQPLIFKSEGLKEDSRKLHEDLGKLKLSRQIDKNIL